MINPLKDLERLEKIQNGVNRLKKKREKLLGKKNPPADLIDAIDLVVDAHKDLETVIKIFCKKSK